MAIYVYRHPVEPLSVAQDQYRSDRISACISPQFKITVTDKSEFCIQEYNYHNRKLITSMVIGVDLNSLIQFLQEAKQLVEEREMMDKLIG